MTIKQSIKLIKRYNRWRRGAKTKQLSSTDIGIALDVMLKYCEKQTKSHKHILTK